MRVRDAVHEAGADRDGDDRQFITALARGLDILDAFTPHDRMLGNQELAERTGLSKTTISRQTYTLTRLGYLIYLPRFAKYRLGFRAIALGQAALAGFDIREAARPEMQRLSDDMQASVFLGSRDRDDIIFIEQCRPAVAVSLQLGIGSRVPLATTAIGRAYYAAARPAERAEIEAMLGDKLGDEWPKLRKGLVDAAEMHAALGFTISVGEWNKAVNSAGAAFLSRSGAIMALNCGAPAFLLPRDRLLQEAGPRLATAARQIAALS